MPPIDQDAGDLSDVDAESLSVSHDPLLDIEDRGVVVNNRKAVSDALGDLQNQLGLGNEVFSDFGRSIILVAAVNRLAVKREAGESDDNLERFLTSVVTEAAGVYVSPEREVIADAGVQTQTVSDERKKTVYDKYTQPELTREMDEYIQRSPVFIELRKRLGAEEEEPFEVKVLSVDAGNISGLIPPADFSDEDNVEDRLKEHEFRRSYAKGLKDRTDRFLGEVGRESVFAPAWVVAFKDGSRYMCLASPLAEKVLYPQEERPASYDTAQYERDLAMIQHEYVHTQGAFVESDSVLGIALEELRAEHFSGNRHGYTDIKRFFKGVKMLTGYDPASSFEIEGRHYDRNEALADIAKNISLEGLLDCMTAIPFNYAQDEEADNFVNTVVAYNDGLSGLFRKMYERCVEQNGLEAVDANVSYFVDKLREAVEGKQGITVESWFAYGGIDSLRDIGIENFRYRYPDEADGYDYWDTRE